VHAYYWLRVSGVARADERDRSGEGSGLPRRGGDFGPGGTIGRALAVLIRLATSGGRPHEAASRLHPVGIPAICPATAKNRTPKRAGPPRDAIHDSHHRIRATRCYRSTDASSWGHPTRLANGGSVHHTDGQTSETFSQAISRCSITPSTIRGGGIRIISPFSNRTPRGCFVPIRPGSGAASTVVTSCLPSYV
jgi:hypothetical protein